MPSSDADLADRPAGQGPAADAALARRALALLDLTSLKDDDSEASIDALAAKAAAAPVAPAALCVYPAFVPAARRGLDARGCAAVRVATVINFPHGLDAPAQAAADAAAAVAAGADEIDVVIPWTAWRDGQAAPTRALLAAVRGACRDRLLKVILETGELREPSSIRAAADLAIAMGADFLKTSTGKVPVNATPEAVAVLLEAIVASGGRVGLKVSGGVATLEDARRYLAQAAAALGDEALTPASFRFGASGLLVALQSAALAPSTPSVPSTASASTAPATPPAVPPHGGY